MIGRLLSSMAIGLFLSFCGGALIALVGTLTNLPRILTGLSMLLRSFLRLSYYVYAWLLSRPQALLGNRFALDLLAPRPRTWPSVLLSLALGWGILSLFTWTMTIWWLLIFVAHGLLIGLAWEKLVQAGEFQLGERMP